MDRIELPRDLKECVAFHGHLCPGLVIGYCATKLGMRELAVDRAGDEELIAIVENDSCAVDAVQVLSGCTFGKGNLYFRNHGKMVFTFAARRNGRSIRLYLRPAVPYDEEQIPEGERRQHRIRFMLSCDPAELFDVRRDGLGALPDAASIRESAPCDECEEMVMSTRLRSRGGKMICIPCDEATQQDGGSYESGNESTERR